MSGRVDFVERLRATQQPPRLRRASAPKPIASQKCSRTTSIRSLIVSRVCLDMEVSCCLADVLENTLCSLVLARVLRTPASSPTCTSSNNSSPSYEWDRTCSRADGSLMLLDSHELRTVCNTNQKSINLPVSASVYERCALLLVMRRPTKSISFASKVSR